MGFQYREKHPNYGNMGCCGPIAFFLIAAFLLAIPVVGPFIFLILIFTGAFKFLDKL